MPLTHVELPSSNKLGSLPGYVSSGDFKAGIIVIQEVCLNSYLKISFPNLMNA